MKDLGTRLLQLVLDRERELLDITQAAQARELRRQLEVLRNEALIFAIEKEADLTQRLDIVFVSKLHHSTRI